MKIFLIMLWLGSVIQLAGCPTRTVDKIEKKAVEKIKELDQKLSEEVEKI